jgi:hypothetical protein
MVVHEHQYKDRQMQGSDTASAPSPFVVVPSSTEYVEQMQALQFELYDVPSVDEASVGVLCAEHFRNHLRVFPEGQFVALEVDTNRVVGLTVCMRIAYDPRKPLLESWMSTTGYG